MLFDGVLLSNKGITKIYIYRLATDSGMAPCVDNGLFSLAVCKGGQIRKGNPINTGLRHLIGNDWGHSTGDTYVLGTYHDRFLYIARVTDVVTMEEYFQDISKGRTDDIYDYKKGNLYRNNRYKNRNIHTTQEQIIKDIAGQYVLLSNDFVYLGEDAIFIDLVKQYNARFQETKTYTGHIAEQIVKACYKYKDEVMHKPHEPLISKCGG